MFTSYGSHDRERPSPSASAKRRTKPSTSAATLAAGAMLLVAPAPAPAATATTTPAPPAPPAPAAATAPFEPFAPPAPPLPTPPSPLRPPAPLPPAAPTSDAAQGTCAAKLRTPVRGRVAGGWGDGRGHTGVDILAPVGTKVRAAACGTVTFAGREGGYGTTICIRHSTRFRTCYAHLSSMAVHKGTSVATGQLVGRVGMTGRTTGPHLHFETRVDGRARNPSPYLRGARTIPGRLLAPLATPPLPAPATGGAPAATS